MLTLFDETKNPLFRLMCRLVDEVEGGARLTRNEMLRRVRSMPQFRYREAPEIDREREIIDAVFRFSTDGLAHNHVDAPIGSLLGLTELAWLKTMLEDESAAFLLPEELRAKLLERLRGIEPLHRASDWRRFERSDRADDLLPFV